MPLHDLRERLAALPARYPEMLEAAEKERRGFGYAGVEFFRLRPFYTELSRIDPEAVQFVSHPDEAVGDSRISCAFGEGCLLHCRDWYGPEVYYDSLFEYEGNLSRRYFCYVSDGVVDAKFVEELVRRDDGLPQSYRCVGYFGDEVVHYARTDYGLEEVSTAYDEELVPYRTLTRQYEFERLDELRAAYEVREGKRTKIFDAGLPALSLEELAERASKCLLGDVLRVAQHPKLAGVSFACLVLEYSLQHPLPPTLGFGKAAEIQTPEGEDPTSCLSAPDFEYFIELGQDHADVYDELNARHQRWEHSEYEAFEAEAAGGASRDYASHRFVFDFYVRLSKALRPRLGRTGLQLDPEFFVVFRNLENGDVHASLAATLPKRAWAVWQRRIRAAERAQTRQLDESRDYRETKEQLAAALPRAQALLAQAPNLGERRYARDCLFGLRPFYSELVNGTAQQEAKSTLLRSFDSAWDSYHVYDYVGGRLVRIDFLSDGRLIRHFLFDRQPNRDTLIELHVGSGEAVVEEVDVVEYEEGRAVRYTEYGMVLQRGRLTYDDRGRVVRMDEERSFPEHPDSPPVPTTYYLVYDGDALSAIELLAGEERHTVYPRPESDP